MKESSPSVARIAGYRVVRSMATAGANDVFLGEADGPDGSTRRVVLELLAATRVRDERFARSFERAAAAHAPLVHPAIVRLLQTVTFDGRLVLVFEHVDGAPLSHVRGMLKAVGHDVDDTAALHIAAEIFSALAAAHAAKVVHRYLEPPNVLVAWDGTVKVGGFGLPRPAKGAEGYMAPEQAAGGDVTPRADVYAAAVVLWELLTKRRASVRRERSVPRLESLDSLRADVDARVRAVLRRALEPRVEKRNVTAREIAALLREVLESDRGREHLATLMSAVQHEPSVVAPAPPSSRGAIAIRRAPIARESLPTLDMSLPPAMPTSAPRQARMLAANAATSLDPAAERRTSSAKIPAVKPPPPLVRPGPNRTSSGTRSVVRPRVPVRPPDEPAPMVAAPTKPPERVLAQAAIAEPDAVVDAPPPPPRGRRGARTFALVIVVILGGLATADRLGYLRVPLHVDAPAAASVAVPIAPPSAEPTEPSVAPAAEREDDEASSTIPADMGMLSTADLAKGRRIFVDERTVGQTPESVLVKCGARNVRIGSAGRRRVVDVPCGAEIQVGER